MPPVLPVLKYKKRYDRRFHDGPIMSLSFNSYGSMFAAGSLDGTVSVWAVDTANALHRINARTPIHSLVWSTGSEGFVFGCENGTLVSVHLEEVCPFCDLILALGIVNKIMLGMYQDRVFSCPFRTNMLYITVL